MGGRPLALSGVRSAYSLLAYVAVLPLLAYLWWRGRKDPHYRQRWRERFGWSGASRCHPGAVLVHCASVGEVLAARPLIDQMLADAPRWGRLALSCSTPTGSLQIARDYGDRVDQVYFPLDLPGATRRFVRALRPRLVILLERELWPNFLYQAQAQGVPVALVNARLSEHSAASYTRWRALMAPALATLRLVCAQDEGTADRFSALGVRSSRLAISGNIKSDVHVDPALQRKIEAGRLSLGTRPVLTAGSTHAGEDEALLDAFAAHLRSAPQTLLILVPRHPERFQSVADLVTGAGLRLARHSLGQAPGADTQVLLGDTLGELMLWYGVADACFVGGSLIARGGHNPLEVLCLRKPVISGPHTANFSPIYGELQACEAMILVRDGADVFTQFAALQRDRQAALAQAERGQAIYQRMAGATARTLAQLERLVRAHAQAAATPTRIERHGADLVWADGAVFNHALPQLFDPLWWQQQGDAQRLSAGRGNVVQVSDARHSYLLRHYYRGGLMARISRDLFLIQPIAQTRAMREFALLTQLRQRGLLVPRACAARHQRVGACYRADILVELIPDATDVARMLATPRGVSADEWRALGHAVRRLHDEQVDHSDLNCHNLMLDGTGKAWIVDFDKCGFRAGEFWKTANLARLLRSLRKEARLNPALRWRETDWEYFLNAYQNPESGIDIT